MIRPFLISLAATLALLAPPRATVRAEPPPPAPKSESTAPPADAEALQKQATEAFNNHDFPAARAALEKLLELKPSNPAVLYNLACALAQTGDKEAAAQRLVEANSYGYVDFFHMASDPHLAPIHNTITYQAMILGWRELLDARGDTNMESARKNFGEKYTYTKDERLRLLFAAAFDEHTYTEARADIERVARFAYANLFTDLHFDDPADPHPDPWVSVILPTPEDFVRMIRSANVGGYYDHERRRLISQDVGPSLRHEFLHVLHWRHLTRIDQSHPDWIMEGLGTLVEDVSIDDEGNITPVPSWRTNIAKRVEKNGRLVPWRTLMTMPRAQFVGNRPNAQYAQVRAIMLYLYSTGKLTDWYHAYVEGFSTDPTGMAALERVYAKPLADIEKDHRRWLRDLPAVAEEIRPGMASLGVVIGLGRGDGPVIEEVSRPGPGDRAGLRARDIITSLDSASVRTMEDLVRILSDHEPGETVELTVRRGTLHLTLKATLGRAE